MKKIKNIVMLSMVIGAFSIINSSEANVNPEVLKEYENNSAAEAAGYKLGKNRMQPNGQAVFDCPSLTGNFWCKN